MGVQGLLCLQPGVVEHLLLLVQANAEMLDSEILYDRDFDYDYFGFKVWGPSQDLQQGMLAGSRAISRSAI